ncbi:hypothetical protein G7046_g3610 [Stylonectria norvegica]|nr:hypothetical protein G7046_g3610 [Stylonectria norvegica]
MTTGPIHGSAPFAEPAIIIASPPDHDIMRGRKRDRSMTRTSVRAIRCAPSDESSTLRGRSRRRATSPTAYASRASSPSLMSPTRKRLLRARLREHCPSRVASPAEQQRTVRRRRQRTRSRSRGPLLETETDSPILRAGDALSGLRNEVLVDDNNQADDEVKDDS